MLKRMPFSVGSKRRKFNKENHLISLFNLTALPWTPLFCPTTTLSTTAKISYFSSVFSSPILNHKKLIPKRSAAPILPKILQIWTFWPTICCILVDGHLTKDEKRFILNALAIKPALSPAGPLKNVIGVRSQHFFEK